MTRRPVSEPLPGQGAPALPGWAAEPLVACVGGPMDGQWFTAADWRARLAATRRMSQLDQPATACQQYAPAGLLVAHPNHPSITGNGWHWHAATNAATAADTATHEIGAAA